MSKINNDIYNESNTYEINNKIEYDSINLDKNANNIGVNIQLNSDIEDNIIENKITVKNNVFKDNNYNINKNINTSLKIKSVRRRIRLKNNNSVQYLKVINNKKLFSFPEIFNLCNNLKYENSELSNNNNNKNHNINISNVTKNNNLINDFNLLNSIYQIVVRNPYIDKYRDNFYFLKGSGSTLIKNLAYLIEYLFSKENANYNKKFNSNLNNQNSHIIDIISNIYSYTINNLKDIIAKSFELTIDSNVVVIKNIYESIINSLIQTSSINNIKTVIKTRLIDKFIKKILIKRKKILFELIFSGLIADIYSCKNCGMSEIKIEKFNYIEIDYKISNNNKSYIKEFISYYNIEEYLEEYYCTKCEITVYFKIHHKRQIIAYPKIISIFPKNNNWFEYVNIEHSFIINNNINYFLKKIIKKENINCYKTKDNFIVYKLFSNIKQNKSTFFSQIKYEDNCIYEFRIEEPVLLYVSELFSPNKEGFIKGLFYYDTNFKINT